MQRMSCGAPRQHPLAMIAASLGVKGDFGRREHRAHGMNRQIFVVGYAPGKKIRIARAARRQCATAAHPSKSAERLAQARSTFRYVSRKDMFVPTTLGHPRIVWMTTDYQKLCWTDNGFGSDGRKPAERPLPARRHRACGSGSLGPQSTGIKADGRI